MPALRKDDLPFPGLVPGEPECGDVRLRAPAHHLSSRLVIPVPCPVHSEQVQQHVDDPALHPLRPLAETRIPEIRLDEQHVGFPGYGIG